MADTTVALLDTPKRQSLSTLANSLRSTLKDWEKSFAASHDHRKPDKEDIKACTEIARTYKEYNRVRDVLAGKLPPRVLKSPTQQRRTSLTSRITRDSSINGDASWEYRCTPPKKQGRKSSTHLSQFDAPASASPRPVPRTAIGPTPQRDGKVLGLFDTLSGRRTHSTPSTRKRKVDALMEGPGQSQVGVVAQTPTKDRRQSDDFNGDLLDHMHGTPQSSAKRQRHSRTPASAGKKFMLSHFFASPPGLRIGNVGQSQGGGTGALDFTPQSSETPLRTHVLSKHVDATGEDPIPAPDATPAYLRRSHSFKDRLLSVTSKYANSELLGMNPVLTSPARSSIGPRALHRCKPAPKPLSEIVRGLQKIEDERHDDDLDALRELEGQEINVLSGDGQKDEVAHQSSQSSGTKEQMTTKVWRKKGQKRTTKRSHMRPVKMRPQEDSRWVAEESGEDEETSVHVVEVTQLDSIILEHDLEHDSGYRPKRTTDGQDRRDDAQTLPDTDLGDAGSDYEPDGQIDTGGEVAKMKLATGDRSTRPKKSDNKGGKKRGPMINPNAVSHMNFRSLKIKNKNSKAKGGRARFGRRSR